MQRWHPQFCISRDSQMISSNLSNEKVECKCNHCSAIASTKRIVPGHDLLPTFKFEIMAGTLLNPFGTLYPCCSTSHVYRTCREHKSHNTLYNQYPVVLESTKVWDDCMNSSSFHNRSVWGCHLTTRTLLYNKHLRGCYKMTESA